MGIKGIYDQSKNTDYQKASLRRAGRKLYQKESYLGCNKLRKIEIKKVQIKFNPQEMRRNNFGKCSRLELEETVQEPEFLNQSSQSSFMFRIGRRLSGQFYSNF